MLKKILIGLLALAIAMVAVGFLAGSSQARTVRAERVVMKAHKVRVVHVPCGMRIRPVVGAHVKYVYQPCPVKQNTTSDVPPGHHYLPPEADVPADYCEPYC